MALTGQVGDGAGRRVSLCPLAWGAATQFVSPVSFSLREEFLGHSHCCPIPWIPHDNKVERAGWAARAWGVRRSSSSLSYLPLPLTAHLLAHAGHPNMGGSMQRMNPPRGMGPMGPGPQVSLGVRPFP